ncbi:T9SS type A sorting domain-containing protein [Flavobacterium limnophilum]|uniref:T9SS type A sorting domain-containing protein n=1 Tax=Flavobacterium limnophilum TaxID=3003262 RepID=UPI0024829802|nr:T9SS type A sorting domain-containing protein [Flavobacterium limnophilum]
MKKKLLYLTSILLFSASINAQTTWDFSTAATTIGTVSTNNSATIYLDPTVDAAAVKYGPTYNTGTPATIVTTGFPGLEFGYKNSTSTKYTINFLNEGYFQANGKDVILTITGCTAGENIAVKYSAKSITPVIAQEFAVPSTVSASIVTAFPTNCTVNTATSTAISSIGTEDIQVVNLTVTADGNVNLLAGSPGFRILKIVRGGTIVLGVNDSFQKESDVVVYANDGKINLSNIKSSTKVEVYNVLGALVQSAQADADTTLVINSGVYIVKAQSADGQKTVKVIVQ